MSRKTFAQSTACAAALLIVACASTPEATAPTAAPVEAAPVEVAPVEAAPGEAAPVAQVTVPEGAQKQIAGVGTPSPTGDDNYEPLDVSVIAEALEACAADKRFDGTVAFQAHMGWRDVAGGGSFAAYPATSDGRSIADCAERRVTAHALEIGPPFVIVRGSILFGVKTKHPPERASLHVRGEGAPGSLVASAQNVATQCAARFPVPSPLGWNLIRVEGEPPTGGMYLRSVGDPPAANGFSECAKVVPLQIPVGSHQLVIEPTAAAPRVVGGG